MATLKIDLLVDEEKNRVVFAESGGDFVDILFSFLTLPIGTIVRLLGKQSSLGCFDKLFQSIENLDTDLFETEACRTLLLHPRNAAENECKKLKINIDDSKYEFYACPPQHKYSLFCGLQHCPSCDELMRVPCQLSYAECRNGVFVEGMARFIIRDDFKIIPLSISSTFAVLHQFDIKNVASLQRKKVDVGKDEVLCLLKMAMLSRSPLSDVFLKRPDSNISVPADHKFIGFNPVKIESESGPEDGADPEKSHVKFIYSVLSNKFLQAEVEVVVADLLFGFLAFPLGSVVKIFSKDSSLGSLDNLYKSVENLGIGDYIKSEKEKEMLLSPKLYPYHSCRDALVKIDEKTFDRYIEQMVIDPKKLYLVVNNGGFVKRLAKFTVSQDLVVTPLSPISTIEIYRDLNEPISSLAEMEVSIGEVEALDLLKACLVSPTPLKELFYAKQGRKA